MMGKKLKPWNFASEHETSMGYFFLGKMLQELCERERA